MLWELLGWLRAAAGASKSHEQTNLSAKTIRISYSTEQSVGKTDVFLWMIAFSVWIQQKLNSPQNLIWYGHFSWITSMQTFQVVALPPTFFKGQTLGTMTTLSGYPLTQSELCAYSMNHKTKILRLDYIFFLKCSTIYMVKILWLGGGKNCWILQKGFDYKLNISAVCLSISALNPGA